LRELRSAESELQSLRRKLGEKAKAEPKFRFYAQKRLRERMKQVFSPAAPVAIVERIERANLILCGWVNYFRVGNSSSVFHDIRSHVEMKVRRVLQRQAHRYGRGWKRYDYAYLYQKLGLYADYRVRWQYA
jgi:RNA-directed DNA polymerase